MTPREYVEENWRTFNQGGGNSVEDMTRLIAAWDSAELRRQSQELEAIKAVARESVEALARYCGQRKYRKIHLRQVFASVDALAALTQPAPEKGDL